MAELLICRSADRFGRLRRIRVRVDGVTVARLLPSEETMVPLAEGTYSVTAQQDWASSYPVKVVMGPDTVRKLEVGYKLSTSGSLLSFQPGFIGTRLS